MPREPVVAGQFYSSAPERLKADIENSFLNIKFGPGRLPDKDKSKKRKIIGAIVPHAGYLYSGPGAAHSYKALAEAEKADLYLILGTGHSTPFTCFSDEDFETPLGIAKNDREFCKLLKKNGIAQDNSAHYNEHSIEVQLPFMQFIFGNDFKFAPVIIGQEDTENISKKIKKSIDEYKERGKKIIIIASSDFTHLGAAYGYFPFHKNIKEKMYELDERAIGLIKRQDSAMFLEYCERTGATICGKYPIAVMIDILKEENNKIELLKYYTSADIIRSYGDYSNAVGYASVVVEKL